MNEQIAKVSSADKKAENDQFLKNFFENQLTDGILVDSEVCRGTKTPSKISRSVHKPIMSVITDEYEVMYKQEECPATGEKIDIFYPQAVGPVNICEGSIKRTPESMAVRPVEEYRTPLEKRVPAFILNGISRIPFVGRLYKAWFKSYRQEQLNRDIFLAFGQSPETISTLGKFLNRRSQIYLDRG